MKQAKPSGLGLRERKKQAVRSTIIKVAMGLFATNGYHQTSMEGIADRSDVSKATLYKYFPVKEAIIAAHWQQDIKNSQQQFQQIIRDYADTRSRLEAAYSLIMTRIMQNRQAYEIYISYRLQHITKPELNKELRSGIAEILTVIIAAGQQLGEIRNDIPFEILLGNLEMLSVIQALVWLRFPQQFSIETTSKIFTDLFLNGAASHAS